MDEYDFLHWRRSLEEGEALIRDISCRKALGLPLEEPGRYVVHSCLRKDQYDPENALYRYDYCREPKNSEKTKQERLTDAHNKAIVGKKRVTFGMKCPMTIASNADAKRAKGIPPREYEEEDANIGDDDEDDHFDFSCLNGTVDMTTRPTLMGQNLG